MRAFIAAEVPCSRQLARLIAKFGELGRAIRPVAGENLHVTLWFLGEIDDGQIPQVQSVLSAAVVGIEPLTVCLAGLGMFPDERRPSVLWVGVDDAGVLGEIKQRMVPGLHRLGHEAGDQKWHPHMTIARIKARPPSQFWQLAETCRHESLGACPIEALHLISSDLGSTGAVYKRVVTVPLGS